MFFNILTMIGLSLAGAQEPPAEIVNTVSGAEVAALWKAETGVDAVVTPNKRAIVLSIPTAEAHIRKSVILSECVGEPVALRCSVIEFSWRYELPTSEKARLVRGSLSTRSFLNVAQYSNAVIVNRLDDIGEGVTQAHLVKIAHRFAAETACGDGWVKVELGEGPTFVGVPPITDAPHRDRCAG